MDKERRELLKAVEIVATCKVERLDLVLDILRQAGFDISNELFKKAIKRNFDLEAADLSYTRVKRENRYRDSWCDTDNQVVLSLREGYLSGFKAATIAKYAGLPRTSIYAIMSGCRNITQPTAESLIHAFSLLKIPYPINQSTSEQNNNT